MTAYPRLFSPLTLGPLRLRNRVVASGTTTNYADEAGRVTERLIAYYAARARGGVGLLITESAIVERRGLMAPRQLACFDDTAVAGLASLATAVHRAGVPIMLQLAHGGGQAREAFGGEQPVGPSEMLNPRWGTLTRGLSEGEVEAIAEAHLAAARRAERAGFDGVELHAAHGYLLGQFVSPFYNRRDDRYGGTVERRTRALIDLVQAIQRDCRAGFLVLVRMSADDGIPGGNTIEQGVRIARLLAEAGVDALDVSAGQPPARHVTSPPAGQPEAALAHLAGAVRAAAGVPVVAVGRILSPATAEAILAAGQADLVALARALIADPDWARKAAEGREAEIIPCIGCQVCTGRTRRPEIVCPVNPRTGRELEGPPAPARRPRRVMVVGSGMAGLECARVAAQRGHRVRLVEPGQHLGGLAALRAASPLQREGQSAIEYWLRALDEAGARMEAGVADLRASLAEAEVVVDARAGEPLPAGVERALGPSEALDALLTPAGDGRGVAVLADGVLGAEVAHALAAGGYRVTLLERSPELARDAHPSVRLHLLAALEAIGVRILVEATVTPGEAPGCLSVARPGHPDLQLPIDEVVAALGFTPARADLASLAPPGCEVHVLGDAYRPDDAAELVVAAHQLARAF